MPNKRRSRISRNNRNKGNSLERETAKILSQWIYGDEKVLRRTPLSGGWSGAKMGDLVVDPEYARKKIFIPNIYVECRNYRDVLGEGFFRWVSKGSPKTIRSWVEEVEGKADGRMPIIVIKSNRSEPWIFVRHKWLSFYQIGIMMEMLNRLLIIHRKKQGNKAGYIMFPLRLVEALGDAKEFFRGKNGSRPESE